MAAFYDIAYCVENNGSHMAKLRYYAEGFVVAFQDIVRASRWAQVLET